MDSFQATVDNPDNYGSDQLYFLICVSSTGKLKVYSLGLKEAIYYETDLFEHTCAHDSVKGGKSQMRPLGLQAAQMVSLDRRLQRETLGIQDVNRIRWSRIQQASMTHSHLLSSHENVNDQDRACLAINLLTMVRTDSCLGDEEDTSHRLH